MDNQKEIDDVLAKIKRCQELGCSVPIELFGFLDVIEAGAKKYEPNNWLLPNGKGSSHTKMHDSMFHHLASSFAGNPWDLGEGGTGLLHLYLLQCRAGMLATRLIKGIKHESD